MCFLACVAQAANVGDRYETVIRDHGEPVGQVVMGNRRVLSYPKLSIRLKDDVVVSVTPVAEAPASKPAASASGEKGGAAANLPNREVTVRARNTAELRVKEIVNQPVSSQPITRGMRVSSYPEGWFHEGATKPDFERVDVRATQELPYANKPFVTSPLNPGVAFPGPALEFNSMIKYFYTDRSVPKKKLTEAEMVEVNALYRVIGKCERDLQALARAATGGR
ncbi:MAG: hypothetical protein U1F61_22725 [Opitutaceae bacterium]